MFWSHFGSIIGCCKINNWFGKCFRRLTDYIYKIFYNFIIFISNTVISRRPEVVNFTDIIKIAMILIKPFKAQ